MARWLGLDITSSSVRLALLRSSYRRISVQALREERLADHETPSAAIRAAMTGVKADSVATALGGERTFVRVLSLPAAAQKELESILNFEVEASLPVELDDAVMDHRMLRPIKDMDAPAQLPILAGVAYTEEVRDRLSLVLRGTGLEPQRIGVGPLPLANFLQVSPQLQNEPSVAFLELDDFHSDVLILKHGEPRFVRSLSRGVHNLPAEAAAFTRELRQTFGAWRLQGGEALQTLYVVGSGKQIAGLSDYIQRELGMMVADLPKLNLDGVTPEQQADLPRFAKAISLALSLSRRTATLDLRQGPLEAQQSYQFIRDKVPLLSGLAAAILVSFGFSVFAESRALDTQTEALNRQLEVATEVRFGSKTRDLKKAEEMFNDAIAGKTSDPIPKMDAFDVMVELSKRIPSDLVHDIAEFDFSRGEVTIKGIVSTIEDAGLVANAMREHECFKEVTDPRTQQLKGKDKQKYTLSFKVECEGEGKATSKGKKGKKSKAASKPKGGLP